MDIEKLRITLIHIDASCIYEFQISVNNFDVHRISTKILGNVPLQLIPILNYLDQCIYECTG